MEITFATFVLNIFSAATKPISLGIILVGSTLSSFTGADIKNTAFNKTYRPITADVPKIIDNGKFLRGFSTSEAI